MEVEGQQVEMPTQDEQLNLNITLRSEGVLLLYMQILNV